MSHLTATQIQAFIAREIAPANLLEIDDHLVACDECRTAVQSAPVNDGQINALRAEFRKAEPHLSYEEVRQLAEGSRVRAAAAYHVAHCKLCNVEVADLKQFIEEQPAISFILNTNENRAFRFLKLNPAWSGLAIAAVLMMAAGLVFLRTHSASNTTATKLPVPAVASPVNSNTQPNPGTSTSIPHTAPAKFDASKLADLLLPVYPERMLRGDNEDSNFTQAMAAYRSGDCSKTVEELATVHATAEDNLAAHLYSGACQLKLQRLNEAAKSLRVVAEAGDTPELEPALYELAQVALAQRNPAQARKYLEQTIALHGDYEKRAQVQVGKLQQLKAR